MNEREYINAVLDEIVAKMEKELKDYPMYNHDDSLAKCGYRRAISDLKWIIRNYNESEDKE